MGNGHALYSSGTPVTQCTVVPSLSGDAFGLVSSICYAAADGVTYYTMGVQWFENENENELMRMSFETRYKLTSDGLYAQRTSHHRLH